MPKIGNHQNGLASFEKSRHSLLECCSTADSRSVPINLGLRWDLYTHPVDANNHQSNFLTSGPNAGLIQIASSSNRGPNVNTYYGNWAPRVGAAFTPDNGKTAIRGAFGISYFPDNFGANGGTLERNYPETLIENNSGANSNCNTLMTPTAENSGCGSLILANGLPGIASSNVYSPLVVPPITPGGFVSPPKGFGVFSVASNFRQDEAMVWNVSVERQLTRDISIHAAYVGTAGRHLYHDYQLNQCDPTSFTTADTPPSYPSCLPFYGINPNITTVDARNSTGASHYNAGQFVLDKRAGHGLTLTAAYTWSKMMDNVNNPIGPYVTRQELDTIGWQRNNFPQVLTLSYVYTLPFGRGQQFAGGASGIVNAIIGGWGLSGITNFRSGGPFFVSASNHYLLPETSGQRADYVCSSPHNPQTIQKWFDTSCYAQPIGFRWGNDGVGEGHAYGPRYQDWDMTAFKGWNLGRGEHQQLNFYAQFFNVFNHTNLQMPNTNLTNSGFGTISGDFLPRQGQLGMTYSF